MSKNSADSAEMGFVRSKLPFLPRNAAGKRYGPVEEVIAWAWREELPKTGPHLNGPMPYGSSWAKTDRFAEYLTLVDSYGIVPDFSAGDWPHHDAVLIGGAVMALDELVLELPEDWRPAPELDGFGGLGAKAVADAWRKMTIEREGGMMALRLKPSELIIRRAIMGYDTDAMKIDDVEKRYEAFGSGQDKWFVRRHQTVLDGINADGTERTKIVNVEVDGWSSRTRRPLPGAYRKPYLDPDPVTAIIARAEHEIWLSALSLVVDDIARQLSDVVMLSTAVPAAPWLVENKTRSLPDLVTAARLEQEEHERHEAALAARFPRWFRRLQNISPAPA